MTREELIDCIYNDNGLRSCNTTFCEVQGDVITCRECAERQLKEYEHKIIAAALDEFVINLIGHFHFTSKEEEWILKLAEQIKEKKNDSSNLDNSNG